MWIESHQSLRQHPKTLRAARALQISPVLLIGHLHCLWWWAIDYAPDGDLSSYDTIDIAAAAEWDGEADLFVDALRDAAAIGDRPGFLEDRDGALYIHDWWDYAGKLLAKREQDAERKRERRGASGGHPTDIRRTSDGHPQDGAGNKQNKTKQTEPNITEPNQPTPPPARAETRVSDSAPRNGHGGDGAAVGLSVLSAEQWVAVQFVQKVAPDFRDIEGFVRASDPRLVAYWALSAGQDVARLDNPAGLIRSMVTKSQWPNIPGALIEDWKTAVKSNAWRNSRLPGASK